MKLLMGNGNFFNPFGENITRFVVKKGESIRKGDFVVVNTRTWEASLPKKEGGYFAVGQAIEAITCEDGTKIVICKDGIYRFRNTSKSDSRITENNTGRACYFEDAKTVTLDNINATKAGCIISMIEQDVVVKISVTEGSEGEW